MDTLPDYTPTLDPVTTCENALSCSLATVTAFADTARLALLRAVSETDTAALRGASRARRARAAASVASAAAYAARVARLAADVEELVRAGRAALAAGDLEYAGRCAGGAADATDAAYAASEGAVDAAAAIT